MSVSIIFIQFLTGLILLQILREIKLIKCAINRFERIKKPFAFKCINKNEDVDKDIELFPIKSFGNPIFTREEIAAITTREFIKNGPVINQQMQ